MTVSLSQISTLLIDWSGVLSDDRRPVYEANMRVIEARGKKRLSFDEWLAASLVGAREFFESQGIAEDPDRLFEEYARLMGEVRTEGLFPVAYPDALPFLQAASQTLRIVVLSSHPDALLRQESAEYGFEEYITKFVGNLQDKSSGIDSLAPSPEIRKTCAYLGDSIFDVRFAKKSGVLSIAIPTGYHSRERLAGEHPDLLVDSLTKLKEMFAGEERGEVKVDTPARSANVHIRA